MGAAKPTVHVLCDNGTVMEHDLPLPPGIAARVKRGQLRLVAANGGDLPDQTTPPPGDSANVPTGTIAEVLAWVGTDPARAALALSAEQDRGGKARTSLVDKLDTLTGGPVVPVPVDTPTIVGGSDENEDDDDGPDEGDE